MRQVPFPGALPKCECRVSHVVLTSVQRVYNVSLGQVTDALKKHGLPFEHWVGLLSTGGAINAIAKGALDKVSIVFISCLQCASRVL